MQPDSAMQPSNGRLIVFFVVVLLAAAIDIGAFWVLGRIELGYTARIAVALTPLPGLPSASTGSPSAVKDTVTLFLYQPPSPA